MSSEQPVGIVVLVYDVPTETSLTHAALAIETVRRLGPGKVLVDHAGPGTYLAQLLQERGISVQAMKKPLAGLADPDDTRLRVLNCRALLERAAAVLVGEMTDPGLDDKRKNLLFDIEALSERC